RATQGKPDRNAVYHYSTFVGSVVYYGIVLVVLIAISGDEIRTLLAFRPPRSWARAAGIAGTVIVAVIVLEVALNPLLHPDREQGLTPTHWEASRAGVKRSEEHTSELQSRGHLVCRLLLEKKKRGR